MSGLVAQQDGVTVTVFAFDVAGDKITPGAVLMTLRKRARG
jgi:hypothetical protein